MKGNADFPQCGFSANSVSILKHLNQPFKTFDILQDNDIRQGLKEYSNWPTFPQLYFNGKLLGGNDIITEMFEEGELQEVLK
jgi:monothiol glutaredoxin